MPRGGGVPAQSQHGKRHLQRLCRDPGIDLAYMYMCTKECIRIRTAHYPEYFIQSDGMFDVGSLLPSCPTIGWIVKQFSEYREHSADLLE